MYLHVLSNPRQMAAYLSGPQAGIYTASKFALRRPGAFAASGFAPPDRAELERFGTAFDAGMDPLEVGRKTLQGMRENRGLILTHPEFREDFAEIFAASVAALPDERAPESRLDIERLRREANRAAAAGHRIGLDDLT